VEPEDVQLSLLRDEPPPTGDERWDALLAAVAEHLAAQHDLAPPEWAETRVLQQPWFPAELETQRAGLNRRLRRTDSIASIGS
jgi:hypothetical protein